METAQERTLMETVLTSPNGNCPGENSPNGNCPGENSPNGNCPGENSPNA